MRAYVAGMCGLLEALYWGFGSFSLLPHMQTANVMLPVHSMQAGHISQMLGVPSCMVDMRRGEYNILGDFFMFRGKLLGVPKKFLRLVNNRTKVFCSIFKFFLFQIGEIQT